MSAYVPLKLKIWSILGLEQTKEETKKENQFAIDQTELLELLSRLEQLENDENQVRARLSLIHAVPSYVTTQKAKKKKSSKILPQTPSVIKAGEIVQERGLWSF